MSEFGKGLTYCLALFLCHSERTEMHTKDMPKKLDIDEEHRCARNSEMWFNGASDHLYDLQIPKTLPETLQKRLKKLQDKAINWGHGFESDCKTEDKDWAIFEAKDLIRLVDKHFGIKTQKGQWQ